MMSFPRVSNSFASLYSVIRLAKCKANLIPLCFDIIKGDFPHLDKYNPRGPFLPYGIRNIFMSNCIEK